MGTHISKVKSVDLDTWLPDQVDNMVKWGNARAAKYWEANLKDRKPSESNIDGWIRAKYEHKRWAMKGPIPDPSALGGDGPDVSIASPQVVEPTPVPAKAKPSSDLDAFLAAPSTRHRTSNSSSPAQQLHGADFFASHHDNVVRQSSSAPVTPAQSRPDTPASADPVSSKHKDLKSSILSLYNSPRSGGTFSPQPAAATSYANNIGNYQHQLSGLSLGPPSGKVPQPPPQQADLYQNEWGGFQETSIQPAWPASGFQQTGVHMPQGGQFFSIDQNTRPSSHTSGSNATQRPTFDAFADLANFGS